MHNLGKNVLTFALFILAFSLAPYYKCNGQKFIFGVNGHPFTQESYRSNIDLQIEVLKKLKCKYYRVDIELDSNGRISGESLFEASYLKFKRNRISILPVIAFSKEIYRISDSSISYKKGFYLGSGFAKRYKEYFVYFEIGNEEGNNIIYSAAVDGDKIDQYNPIKYKILMPYFKGVCDAMKKYIPKSKIIINESWVHYGFFDLLKKYEVNYDVVGYHAYSDMGDFIKVRKGFGDVLLYLYKRYNKVIWITEFNVKNGVSQDISIVDKKWFMNNLSQARKKKYVGGLFVYELFDQPAFDNPNSPYRNPNEAYYGLLSWLDRYTLVKEKKLFFIYKRLIIR